MDAIERQQKERGVGAALFAVWLLICVVAAGMTAGDSYDHDAPAVAPAITADRP